MRAPSFKAGFSRFPTLNSGAATAEYKRMSDDKKSAGRISDYDKVGGDAKAPAMARQMCLMGATEVELGLAFGVDRRTITNWKNEHPLFKAAILEGREVSDDLVVRRLFERATGYEHPEEKIFYDAKTGLPVRVQTTKHYAPDPVSGIFWLKNRRPKDWRDKQVIEGDPENPIVHKIVREIVKPSNSNG